jgi:hypothetical protein
MKSNQIPKRRSRNLIVTSNVNEINLEAFLAHFAVFLTGTVCQPGTKIEVRSMSRTQCTPDEGMAQANQEACPNDKMEILWSLKRSAMSILP